jgi:hypothetical protein
MFFNKSRLEKLERELVLLEDLFADALKRIAKLEEARYGLKVDGTPKAKPGRKAKDVRIS